MSDSPTYLNSRPLLVDRREAGRILGVSAGTIDNLRLRGELPSLKIMGRRLYDVSDLHALVAKKKEIPQVRTVNTSALADSPSTAGITTNVTSTISHV